MTDQLIHQLLQARATADPGLRQLLPLLGIPTPVAEPESPVPESRAEPVPDLTADRDSVYRGVRGAEAELRRCHGLLRHVSSALGACAACLGTDSNCCYCSGAGVPGTYEIDEPALRRLVRPLLDHMCEPMGGHRVHDDI